MVTDWYDSFLPWQLEDFAALQRAGRPRQLIIVPWSQAQEGFTAASVREGLAWLRGPLLGDPRLIEPVIVRVFITGERTGGGWHDFERWPPAEGAPRQLWIEGEDRLAWDLPPAGGERQPPLPV